MGMPRFAKILNSSLTKSSMEVRDYLFRNSDSSINMTINPQILSQRKSLEKLGGAFIEIGRELQTKADSVDKISITEAFKAYTDVSEVFKPKAKHPSPTKS